MPKTLERDLGLFATFTISIGAMIGSGIFVLPGLAAEKAGPSVILAYLLAGVIVLPAALSKAEMATALPESGGTYLYIDRAMGPLPGTVAGIGAWFSLVFKSAFALVGLGAYLLLLVEIPAGLLTLVGLGIAVLLIVVNVLGVKQTGRLQATIVSLVLLSLIGFVADGSTYVDQPLFHPFFEEGASGLLAATGFVFVSYAGVTKIASVAEEIEDPGRTIPRAMLGSIVVMMLVYTLTVFVVVGVTPPDSLHGSLTPMADAAQEFAGQAGRIGIAVVAVLALTSMANAGVLSSSRFPLAMSRDSLAPPRFARISERFNTPIVSIVVTGVLLLGLIAFVPVDELAKLASAFKILLFGLVNVALVAFRESSLEWYEPDFVSPGYPWVQLFGVLGCGVLLTTMGLLALGGAVGIVAAGLVWYRLYGREKTDREGAALDAIRRSMAQRTLDRTATALDTDEATVLVAVRTGVEPERLRALVSIGAAVAERFDGSLHVVEFEAVPEQTSLGSALDRTEADPEFERTVGAAARTVSVPVETEEVVTHNPKRAVVNAARDVEADLALGPWEPDYLQGELLGADVDWYMDHTPCDVGFFRDRGFTDVDEVAVLVEPGLHSPAKLAVADAVAAHNDARLQFVTALTEDATPELVGAAEEFYENLSGLSAPETDWQLIHTDDRVTDLSAAVGDADLVVLGTVPSSTLQTLIFGNRSVAISDRVSGSVLLFYPYDSGTQTFLRKVLGRVAFGSTVAGRRSSPAD